MSRLRIFPDGDPGQPELETADPARISAELERIGVGFEHRPIGRAIPPDATPDTVLELFGDQVRDLARIRGFASVDVVRVLPTHPDRASLRERFLDEHYHEEDEVRFFVAGTGLFFLHAENRVHEVLCGPGDLIAIPDRLPHWFDMGPAPDFTAIRFFTRPDGWVGHLTGDDIAGRFPRYESVTNA